MRISRNPAERWGVLLLMLLLSACNLQSQPEPTATVSADEVLQTAQAIAQATLQAITPTASNTPLPPSATAPLETATPEATATPGTAIITADYNANVRAGPGEEYIVLDFLLAGQTAEVIGRYDNTPLGTWWFVRRIGGGLDGWVWGGAVTLAGDSTGIPVLAKPPTTTPSPEPTDAPGPTQPPPSATLAVTATETTPP